MNSGALALFQERLDHLTSAPLARETDWWRHRSILQEFANRCAYCGSPGEVADAAAPVRIDMLIPRNLGGSRAAPNVVACCSACVLAKGSQDWIQWKRAPSRADALSLEARRLSALASSHNHLLRNPDLGKKKATVLRHLGARWTHPRFAVFAALTDAHGFIGWALDSSPPLEAIAILVGHGGKRTRTACWRLPPARFHDAVWALIDHNAWVRRVVLGDAYPDPMADSPGDGQWHITFKSVLDIRRRRPRLAPSRIPMIERPMDWGERMLLEYQAAWRNDRPVDWDWINKHRETDLAYERSRDAKRRANEALLKELDARLELESQDAEARGLNNLPLIDQYWQELTRRARDPNSGDAWADFKLKYGPGPTG